MALQEITAAQVAEVLATAKLRRNTSEPAAVPGAGAGFEASQEDATCVRVDWYSVLFPGRVRSRLEACAEALEAAGYRVNRLATDGRVHLEVVRDGGGDD